uniref:Uncharacterized protein n=1 Tax=Cacopsylla melanoneura TaxID=428564 RepID=A0A8D9FCQ4_9HEMI
MRVLLVTPSCHHDIGCRNPYKNKLTKFRLFFSRLVEQPPAEWLSPSGSPRFTTLAVEIRNKKMFDQISTCFYQPLAVRLGALKFLGPKFHQNRMKIVACIA